MNRIATVVVACLFAGIFSTTAWSAHRNVVIFLADDLGARDLGYTGSTFYETPNIDALAKRGTVFTSAYSACPVCSPTRAATTYGS